MAHMICQIHAYDVLGDVFVHATVTDHDAPQSDDERQLVWTCAYPGTGEDRHGKWLRDVLQELLEQL